MATSPITIGTFDNVPAPGSPIRSDWPQEVSAWVSSGAGHGVVLVAGDTMTGGLTAPNFVHSAAQSANVAAATRRDYVDGQDALRLVKAGDTMSGNLVVGATPTADIAGILAQPDGAFKSTVITGAAPATIPNLNLIRTGAQAQQVGGMYIRFGRTTSNEVAGSITVAGTATVAYNTTSDPRLKTRVADNDDAMSRVQQLGTQGFKGTWVGDESGQQWDMLLAPDIAAVAPYAVQGEQDAVDADGGIAPMQVNYAGLVPLLITALAQALDRIDALEAGQP